MRMEKIKEIKKRGLGEEGGGVCESDCGIAII
jgi:hypothetical protein